MSELPTGQREGLHLEFKDARALEDSTVIPREVAAMLHTDGGTIWIGVPEANGVACEPESIPDIHRKKEALLNRLIDCIEPGFGASDVLVDPFPIGLNEYILRVTVKAPVDQQKPPAYAWLKSGMRGFAVRNDHRVVTMERMDLEKRLQPLSNARSQGAFERAKQWLAEQQGRVERDYPECSYIAATVEHSGEYAPPATDHQKNWWDAALKLESSKRNPRGTRSLLSADFVRQFDNDILVGSPKHDEMKARWRLEADPRGTLVAIFPTEWLIWTDSKTPEPEDQRQLHPYVVIGAVVSFLELLKGWLSELSIQGSGTIWLQLGFRDQAPSPLRRHSPQSSEYMYWKRPEDLSRRSILWQDGLRVRIDNERLQNSHEGVALQILERIYESFGFSPQDVPFEVRGCDLGLELP